jgi:hypothetical protein
MTTPDDCDRIRRVFDRFEGGEFVQHGDEAPYADVPANGQMGPLVYCTKRSVLPEASRREPAFVPFDALTKAGLPSESERATLVQRLLAERQVFFLGDLDPPDLLIYAWLRGAAPDANIAYLGIDDRTLQEAGLLQDDRVLESATQSLSPEEREALPLTAPFLPAPLEELVGPSSARVLQSGRKIELEALLLRDALLQSKLSARLRDD